MLALMANMYLAIAFDLKYLTWKTNKKAVICVLFIWIVGIAVAVLSSIPLYTIDLGDACLGIWNRYLQSRKVFYDSFHGIFCHLWRHDWFPNGLADQEEKKKGISIDMNF